MIDPVISLLHKDLTPIVKSTPIASSRPMRASTPHVKAVKVISRMRGGSQSRLMLGDDNNLWIVKFKNNPQHLRVLANELIATQIAETLGLSISRSGIIDVSQAIIETNPPLYVELGHNRRELCSNGLQFGSQFAGGMISRQVEGYLADEQLLEARNLEEFAGILAFDKWTGNSDYRQVVYRRNGAERGHSAVFIDQGGCFNLGEWAFRDTPLKGIFAQACAYTAVTGWASFEPWLSRIEQFDPQSLWEIAMDVPREWCGGKEDELSNLIEKLVARRGRVRELITQFRHSNKVPFPNWTSDVSHLSPNRLCRSTDKSSYIRIPVLSATVDTFGGHLESPKKTGCGLTLDVNLK